MSKCPTWNDHTETEYLIDGSAAKDDETGATPEKKSKLH